MKEVLTIRLEGEIKEKLEKIAKATDRSKSYIASKAIIDYIDLNEWEIQAIQKGIEQANSGQVISHKKIKEKWERKRANSMD